MSDKIKEKPSGRSLEDMEVFKHPMCLISTESVKNEHGEEIIKMKEEQEVLNQLKEIDLPMVIVGVVGPCGNGKSVLVNILAESTTGFALANARQPKTKGIWVWCKMHPKKTDTVLLLLDTEGDVTNGATSLDNNMCTLAILLCNCLVYNMRGTFYDNPARNLKFVTEMAENIRYFGESSKYNDALNWILPHFVLCLRNSRGEIEWERKSANEYLKFELQKSSSEDLQQKYTRKYLQGSTCFSIPADYWGDMFLCSDLSDRFKDLVSHIYSIPPKRLLYDDPVNGRAFVILVDNYVTAIKHGAVLDVDDASEKVIKITNATIEKVAVEMFLHEMKGVELSVSTYDFWRCYTKAEQAALIYFRRNVVQDTDGKYEKQAQVKMDKVWNKTVEKDEQRRSMDKLLKEALDKQRKDLQKDLLRHLEIENKKYDVLLNEMLNLKKEEAQKENEKYRSEQEDRKKQLETESEKATRDAEICRKQDKERREEQRQNERYRYRIQLEERKSTLETDRQKAGRDAKIYWPWKQEKERQEGPREYERHRYRIQLEERKSTLETDRHKAGRDAEIYWKQEKERQDDQRRNKENIDTLLQEQQKAQMEALDKQREDLKRALLEHLEIERRKYEMLLEERMKLEKEELQRENERYRIELEETKKQLKTEREKAERESEM